MRTSPRRPSTAEQALWNKLSWRGGHQGYTPIDGVDQEAEKQSSRRGRSYLASSWGPGSVPLPSPTHRPGFHDLYREIPQLQLRVFLCRARRIHVVDSPTDLRNKSNELSVLRADCSQCPGWVSNPHEPHWAQGGLSPSRLPFRHPGAVMCKSAIRVKPEGALPHHRGSHVRKQQHQQHPMTP